MATIAIDINSPSEVITAGRRVLIDALGADGARVFLNSYAKEQHGRSRLTADEWGKIIDETRAEAEAGRGKGTGDFTAERYNEPELSHEELVVAFQKREVEMDTIRREHPEYSLQEQLREQARREAARKTAAV